jgi:dihydrodipicolinate synthase/N-acetylneuraminate lyase
MKDVKDPEFRGVFAYPLTPTSDDGASVDEIRLCELIDEFIDAGASGIVVLGSTGAIGSFSKRNADRSRRPPPGTLTVACPWLLALAR